MDTILRLRELMNSRGWSEYRLAKESKLSMSTISNIFHRGSIPSIPTLETLCNTFGISLGQFFSKGVSFKWSKQKFVCGKIMVKRKITAKLAVIFLKNGGPNRDRTDDLTDANRTLSQLSYRPILPLFAGFCNKKLIFKFSDFRRIQRKTSPKSWTETRRSMCDHRDANRTLSQLSYKPEYEVVWLRYVRLALPAELQAHNYPIIIHILRENARAFSGFFSLRVQYC